jgi:hypothetical protein
MRSLEDLFETWFYTYAISGSSAALGTVVHKREARTAFDAGAASMADLFASGQGLKVTQTNADNAVAIGALNRIISDCERYLDRGSNSFSRDFISGSIIPTAKQGLK